ncbi:MAG: nucleotide exchange factor GrpE [Clostridia bacterium]|nr:nucleotide exchange factor GrpE [Clostridia bacterium]
MVNENIVNDEKQEMDNMSDKADCQSEARDNDNKDTAEGDSVESLKEQLEAKSKKCDEYFNMLQRTMAEFDNYKKRTAREKTELYSEAVCEAVGAFLPVLDNLERAMNAAGTAEANSLKEGVEMIFRQLKDVMKNLGIEEIKGVGEKFDPNLHNAVMHISDDSLGEGVVVEEFQKGYSYKDKVIRHSMVKVAN